MILRHAIFAIIFGAACSSTPSKQTTPPPASTVAVAPKRTTPACDAFFASPGLHRMLGMLDKLATVEASPWSDYRAEHHPVILLGPDRPASPTCALVWRGHELARIALSEPVEIMGPYRFWMSEPLGSHPDPVMRKVAPLMTPAPAELATALASLGITRAMMLRIDFDPALLGQIDVSRYFGGLDGLRFLWIVHETFHLYSQFPTWFDQPARYAWPAWDHQPSRQMLVEACYGGKDARLAKDERAALFEAFNAVYPHEDRSAACAAVQKFVAARAARYASLAEVRIPTTVGESVGCARAAATMELEEGVPTYIAGEIALELGVMPGDQIAEDYRHPILEPFYAQGAFQLMILRGLVDRDAMRAAVARIASSADDGASITHELASQCGAAPVRSH